MAVVCAKTGFKIILHPASTLCRVGWNDVGKTGMKAECLAYIKEVWTDMRPLSLRKKMEEMGCK